MRLTTLAIPPGRHVAGQWRARGLRGAADRPVAAPTAGFKESQMEQKLKIAVFIDFDNIEIGVKSTPVSYTHLDVYKRQPIICWDRRWGRIPTR